MVFSARDRTLMSLPQRQPAELLRDKRVYFFKVGGNVQDRLLNPFLNPGIRISSPYYNGVSATASQTLE